MHVIVPVPVLCRLTLVGLVVPETVTVASILPWKQHHLIVHSAAVPVILLKHMTQANDHHFELHIDNGVLLKSRRPCRHLSFGAW